ncbi:sushi domain-containing protein 5 [Lampris incognitus]|uniref:sushi domain-containing protein 5 n=1 Tax=Lampris incognitus TaxID=2546036 RepID=UPI0024B482C9|nr:sushi domain-containing protein 5 [Lampris incognitus]
MAQRAESCHPSPSSSSSSSSSSPEAHCTQCPKINSRSGRVFLLDLRSSVDLRDRAGAEQACAAREARLASAEELRHAVVECSFSACARGWLYGGAVGTTVCKNVGSAVKTVDVRTENATEDYTHLDAFCIIDKGVPCGDPPSFPNTRLRGQMGFEMGDELLYTCVPGYVMPSGHNAFSLICDSCGEWYGLVQLCVKGEAETHVDYEDKFTYSMPEDHSKEETLQEAHGEVYEEVQGAAYLQEQRSPEQQEASFSIGEEEEHHDKQHEGEAGGGELSVNQDDEEQYSQMSVEGKGGDKERRAGEQEISWTEAPVTMLSQKHLFWFPSEAFQEEGRPVPTHQIAKALPPEGDNRVRASGGQSEESKENSSQEGQDQHPFDLDGHVNHDDSHHHDQDVYNDSHRDDRDDHHDYDDSLHEELEDQDNSRHHDQDRDDPDDQVKHYIPAQHDVLDKHGRYDDQDNHDDHYDMGEHEDERDRVRYGNRKEYGGQDENYDEDHSHERYDDHYSMSEDHHDEEKERADGAEEHPDHDDRIDEDIGHFDVGRDEDDGDQHHYTEQDHYENHEHHGHEQDDLNSYEDHDGHDDRHNHYDDEDDSHQHVVFPTITEEPQNMTKEVAGGDRTATTDETWLDGYPVAPEEMDKGGSTEEEVGPEGREEGLSITVTDRPNEVEVSRPIPNTSLPQASKRPTGEPDSQQEAAEEGWPGLIPTTTPSAISPEPSYSPSHPEYETHPMVPTHPWGEELSVNPFLEHGLTPAVHDDDIIAGTGGVREEHTRHNLTGQTGERGEVEGEMGEMGEAICTGEHCPPPPPPPTSSSRGPTVAAIIVAVCAVATAVIVGVWCYRRQQQKSSMYEMNGKGQSQSRHAQQIEMQQKV